MGIMSLQIQEPEWRQAGQRLIEMAIAEFLYEHIIDVTVIDVDCYRLDLGIDELGHKISYEFKASQRQLGNWSIQPGSVRVTGQQHSAWDLHQFLIALAKKVDVKPFTLAYLIKEMNNTWLAEAHLFDQGRPNSQEILRLSSTEVEGTLRGHPWIVMSKGRMGFSYQDYLNFAPEMQQKQQLLWVAVSKSLATFKGTPDQPANVLYQHEIGTSQRQDFDRIVQTKGKSASDFFFLPVHTWQWHHWIMTNYAGEIARSDIIQLGLSEDQYLPMQSIRTFGNITSPHKHYVKLPLSILNTAVYRGLPSQRNLAAPALTAWLKEIYQQDRELQDTGLILLGEIASVTVKQPCFDQIEGAPYQFKELFGALWRESIYEHLEDGQQVLTQAALVHRDLEGQSILKVLITQSGLAPLVWLKQFVHVCITPLLYCLYRYGVVFSPHGENSLLIHEHGIPKRMVVKDFIDDVNLVEEDFPELVTLPSEVERLLLRHSAQDLSHFIFTGLFVVHYRYIAEVFLQDFEYDEAEFWQQVADVIDAFHKAHPELADRIEKFSIQRPSFEKVCLNRVRLFSQGYADDAERPVPEILAPMDNPVSPIVLKKWHQGVINA
ncbi:IucA/IucC family protein [Aquirhabdus sp.]|uniref:IucA/IucC family protein n=1 Tax=Aquirhabdus sp. TaxID=2824160 RepID=UPI00396C7BEA